MNQVAQPLHASLCGVVNRRIRLETALIDAKHRDAPGELIGNRLPDERRVRPFVVRRAHDLGAGGIDGLEGTFGGRGNVGDNCIEQRLHADVLES